MQNNNCQTYKICYYILHLKPKYYILYEYPINLNLIVHTESEHCNNEGSQLELRK